MMQENVKLVKTLQPKKKDMLVSSLL